MQGLEGTMKINKILSRYDDVAAFHYSRLFFWFVSFNIDKNVLNWSS